MRKPRNLSHTSYFILHTLYTSGQSLFEVVVAIAIIMVIMVSIVVLATSSIRNTSYSNNKTLAAKYSQEAMEWLRGVRDNNWETLAENALVGTWCLKNLAWDKNIACASDDFITGTRLIRELYFTVISATDIEAKIKISWQDAQGLHEVNSVTNFTDWRQQ
jgi:type II secretory pathway pseudopilin PulG